VGHGTQLTRVYVVLVTIFRKVQVVLSGRYLRHLCQEPTLRLFAEDVIPDPRVVRGLLGDGGGWSGLGARGGGRGMTGRGLGGLGGHGRGMTGRGLGGRSLGGGRVSSSSRQVLLVEGTHL